MKYCRFLDTIAFAVDEVLVPSYYMDLMALLKLTLTSKQLRNKINARPNIANFVKMTVGIPRARANVKLLTFFKMRGPGQKLPYNLTTEYALALRDSCILCLRHPYMCRKDRAGNFFFEGGFDRCTTCAPLPPWSKIVKACKHPSHVLQEHGSEKMHGQTVCKTCA